MTEKLKQPPQPIAKALVIDADYRMLVLQRSLWVRYGKRRNDLPGGCVEQGESPLEAVVREGSEETALDLRRWGITELCTVDRHVFFVCYVNEKQPAIKTSWEHRKVHLPWPFIEDAANNLHSPPHIQAVEFLHNNSGFLETVVRAA